MLKKSLIAAALLLSAAAPALASTDTVFGAGDASDDQLAFQKAAVITQLRQENVNASDVSQWGNLIRADVTLADGTSKVQFFEPGSLQPVNPSAIN